MDLLVALEHTPGLIWRNAFPGAWLKIKHPAAHFPLPSGLNCACYGRVHFSFAMGPSWFMPVLSKTPLEGKPPATTLELPGQQAARPSEDRRGVRAPPCAEPPWAGPVQTEGKAALDGDPVEGQIRPPAASVLRITRRTEGPLPPWQGPGTPRCLTRKDQRTEAP